MRCGLRSIPPCDHDGCDVTVRPAADADLDEVARVWREAALSMDGEPADVPTLEAFRKRIDDELGSGWELRVAERGGRIAGMLALKRGEAVLDQIFVAPGDQRSGAGKALLDAAKREMPAGFTLRMAASNERAARFYEKGGLHSAGEGTHPRTGIPVRYYCWSGA